MPSKRFKKLPEKTNLLKPLKINELLPLVKKNCTTKFDESIDVARAWFLVARRASYIVSRARPREISVSNMCLIGGV